MGELLSEIAPVTTVVCTFFCWFCDLFASLFLLFLLECFISYFFAIMMQDSTLNENNSLSNLENLQVILFDTVFEIWKLGNLFFIRDKNGLATLLLV